MPQHYEPERFRRSGLAAGLRNKIRDRLRGHQSGGNWQSTASWNYKKASAGGHPGDSSSGPADDTAGLRDLRLFDRNG